MKEEDVAKKRQGKSARKRKRRVYERDVRELIHSKMLKLLVLARAAHHSEILVLFKISLK